MQDNAAHRNSRFCAIGTTAKAGSVFAEKVDRIATANLPAQRFADLQRGSRAEYLSQRRERFEQLHGAWLAEQNQCFEKHGLWCDEMRVW